MPVLFASRCARTLACVAAIAVLISANSPLAAQTASWPQWRGADRGNRSPDKNLLDDWNKTKPELLWQAEGIGTGYASVSVVDGVVYTTGNKSDGQSVSAVKAADGSLLWSVAVTESSPAHGYAGSRCTPTVDGDHLYVVSSDGQIICLKKANGDEVWRKNFTTEWRGRLMKNWGYAESPLVDGDVVICTPGGPQAMMVALNKLTGKQVWAAKVPRFGDGSTKGGKPALDGAGYSSVVISNGGGVKQYVALVARGLIGVRASDGKVMWSYPHVANGTANIPTPIVSGDYVFASSGYQTGAALLKLKSDGDSVDAEEQYFIPAKTFQNHHGGMVLLDGYIYAGSKHGQGYPICIDMLKGDIKWGGQTRGAGRGSAAITYADGNLIFRYESGEIALIEATPEKYNLKGVFNPADTVEDSKANLGGRGDKAWAQPVVIGGRMFIRQTGRLLCYNVSKAGS